MHHLLDFHRRWPYLVLLVALVVLLSVQPIASSASWSWRLFDALLSLVVLAAILSVARSRAWRWAAGLGGGLALALLAAGNALDGAARDAVALAGHLLVAAFFISSALLTVWGGLRRGRVSVDSVNAVVCGYLLLGVAWAVLYSLVDRAQPGAFRIGEELLLGGEPRALRMSVFLYFSFVTLTTLGYGDVTAISVTARTLAWLEAVVGQLYLAVLIAGLVGALVAGGREERG